MKASNEQEFLTVYQVQERLQIGRTTAYSLLYSRCIPSTRIGRSLRVRESDLERFIKANRY
jgi:excisionase family DNA binding protein